MDGKSAVRTLYTPDRLVLAHVEPVVLGDLAVVLKRFRAGGLLVGAGEGHVADLQQLRRGEKSHVRGVMEERVAQAALVDEHRRKARTLGLDGARHPGRAGANHQQIVDRSFRLRGVAHGSILLKPQTQTPKAGPSVHEAIGSSIYRSTSLCAMENSASS